MKKISINLSGSKSITNRLLVLNSVFDNVINLENISKSKDSQLMNKALSSRESLIDIHHAGTAMRFLTAYYSIQEDREVVITGSKRMKERPIKILVNALRYLGADIEYLENEGFPPLKIYGKRFNNNQVNLLSNVSSQYITALCLIGAKLPKGLNIKLEGKITSFPYINMTLQILNKVGLDAEIENNIINIKPAKELTNQNFIIESDWSSASYHYLMCTISNDCEIELSYLFKDSLQADIKVADIYQKYFGIISNFKDGKVFLQKDKNFIMPKFIELDMNDCPDIAQTVATTAFGLKIPIKINGLETLKIKETDRLQALKNELEKCGAVIEITENSYELKEVKSFNENVEIETYNDHRMAMSFAPLKLLFPLKIKHPEVVEKSYVEFWDDFQKYF